MPKKKGYKKSKKKKIKKTKGSMDGGNPWYR